GLPARTSQTRRQRVTGDAEKRILVSHTGRSHDLPREGRRGRLAVPGTGSTQPVEVVPQRLFIEAGLAPTGLVLVGRPESRGTRRQNLIDQEQAAVCAASELEFGVGDDDPAPGRLLPANAV